MLYAVYSSGSLHHLQRFIISFHLVETLYKKGPNSKIPRNTRAPKYRIQWEQCQQWTHWTKSIKRNKSARFSIHVRCVNASTFVYTLFYIWAVMIHTVHGERTGYIIWNAWETLSNMVVLRTKTLTITKLYWLYFIQSFIHSLVFFSLFFECHRIYFIAAQPAVS